MKHITACWIKLSEISSVLNMENSSWLSKDVGARWGCIFPSCACATFRTLITNVVRGKDNTGEYIFLPLHVCKD